MNEDTRCISPIPYVYDSEDERVQILLQQVVSMCEIELQETETTTTEVEEQGEDEEGNSTTTTHTVTETVIKKEGEDPAVVWGRVWQVIRLLSSLACWTDSDNDTFITQCRTQQVTAKQLCGCTNTCCNCDDDAIVVPLEYSPTADEPFVSGVISVVIGGKLHKKELTAEYLNEHYDHFTSKLYIMREDFPDIMYYQNRCCCMCRRNLTITLRYNAGYDTIPAGVLPLICPILSKIMTSQMSLSQCSSTMTTVAGLLKKKKTGSIEYEWSEKDSQSQATNAIMTDIFNTGLIAELQTISRCDQVTTADELGDVI